MFKLCGNVVDFDDLVCEYGVDMVWVFLMFIVFWELGGFWDLQGINGLSKWFLCVWNVFFEEKVSGFEEKM